MKKMALSAVAALSLVGAQASGAALEGEFVFVGSSAQGTFNGSAFVETNPFDIYHFNVTNNSAFNVFSFGLTFDSDNSSFVNTGLVLSQLGPDLALDPFDGFIPGTQLTPETFFTATSVAPTFVVSTDNADTLYAQGGTLGTPWILAGQTETVAVFSVAAGAGAPTLFFGEGVVNSELSTVVVIPEPATMALLGLGGLALLARRRQA